MYIVKVNIHVKPEFIKSFISATIENASKSIKEPGVKRFDYLQNIEDDTNFYLNEVYLTQEDAVLHKATAHYKTWKSTVEKMMAAPRQSVKLKNIIPDDKDF